MYVVLRGFAPHREESRKMESIYYLSLSHEAEKVLSYCVFGDYLVLLIIVGILDV